MDHASVGHGDHRLITRRAESGSLWNETSRCRSVCKSPQITSVPAFPTLSQTILGGGPSTKLRCRKSLSLETIVNPLARAYCQTSLSTAPTKPRWRRCSHPGSISESNEGSRGLRFSSKSSFTLQCLKAVVPELRRTLDKPGCFRCLGQESR